MQTYHLLVQPRQAAWFGFAIKTTLPLACHLPCSNIERLLHAAAHLQLPHHPAAAARQHCRMLPH
jgi:hypothetical protein